MLRVVGWAVQDHGSYDPNVPYEVFKIRPEITEEGSEVEAGYHLEQREKRTRRKRMMELDKVKGVGEDRLLTDVISLVRHAMGEDEELEPFREEVEDRFYEWLGRQDRQQRFTAEQLEWLEMIKDHLAANVTIKEDDFEYSPFEDKGGIYTAHDLFDEGELGAILDELNDVVTA